jgi:hypothetical protein
MCIWVYIIFVFDTNQAELPGSSESGLTAPGLVIATAIKVGKGKPFGVKNPFNFSESLHSNSGLNS